MPFTSNEVTITPFCGPYAIGIAGPNPYFIPPTNFPTQEAATDYGRQIFGKLGVELAVYATNAIPAPKGRITVPNGWTDIDHFTTQSYAIGQRSIMELARAMANESGKGTAPEGDEIADDDYILVVDSSGLVTVNYAPANGGTPLPASGSWVFRVGGAGSFDTPAGNSRDYSASPNGIFVEAQDASAETPVISTVLNRTAKSFVTGALIGYPIAYEPSRNFLSTHVNSIGYGTTRANDVTVNSNTPVNAPLLGNVWLPIVEEGFPPFTTVPTILGPILPQGLNGFASTNGVYTPSNYNGCIHIFIPRPDDLAVDDDGVSMGRFLRGFRLRIVDIQRSIQTTEQAQGIVPELRVGFNVFHAHLDNLWKAPTVKNVKLYYKEDTGTRWLTQPPMIGNANLPGASFFRFNALEAVPIDMVPGRITSGPAFTTELEGGKPFLTMQAPTSTVFGTVTQGTLIPFQPPYYAPFAPVSAAGFYYAESDGDAGTNGWEFVNKQTQDTYTIQSTYAASTVYVTRTPSTTPNGLPVEVEDYGEESGFVAAFMPRRCEPVYTLARGFNASSEVYISDSFESLISDGAPYIVQPAETPDWEHWALKVDCDNPGHGFTTLETWGGRLAYYDSDANSGEPTNHYSWYYPGYFHRTLEPNSPLVPKGWVGIKQTTGNDLGMQTWGGPSSGYSVWTFNGVTTAQPNGYPPMYVGGTFDVSCWANIKPFEYGGSVPYAMPPPFATNIGEFGQVAGYSGTDGEEVTWAASFYAEYKNVYGPNILVKTPITALADAGAFTVNNHHVGYRNNAPFVETYVTFQDSSGPPSILSGEGYTDAFYGVYSPHVYPDPVPTSGYTLWTGKIQLWIAEETQSPPITIPGIERYGFALDDGRRAYWGQFSPGQFPLYNPADSPVGGRYTFTSPPAGKVFRGFDTERDFTYVGEQPIPAYAGAHYSDGPKTFYLASNDDLTADKITTLIDPLTGNIIIDTTRFRIGVASPEIGLIGRLRLHGTDGDFTFGIYTKPQRKRL